MRVSVILPTYNAAAFVRHTIDSILEQSVQPHEVIALDDGSSDATLVILRGYRPRISVYSQGNRGVANTRNSLCSMARGDLVAFIDHDDLWHRDYLKTQCEMATRHPSATALFTGHVNFSGTDKFDWSRVHSVVQTDGDLISPIDFLRWYSRSPGPFASMSYCCIPRDVLCRIGNQPFCSHVSGADDFHLFNLLPLYGPVAYTSATLAAYRMLETGQSENLVTSVGLAVRSLELLQERYDSASDEALSAAFRTAFAAKRRHYAKILFGAKRASEARSQLARALRIRAGVSSTTKCLALLLAGALPNGLLQCQGVAATRSAHHVGNRQK